MFTLHSVVNYEGEGLHGVFDSKNKALAAYMEYEKKDSLIDWWEIREFELNKAYPAYDHKIVFTTEKK